MPQIFGGHFVLVEGETSNAPVSDYVHITWRCTKFRKVVKDFLFCPQKNFSSKIQRPLKISSVRVS